MNSSRPFVRSAKLAAYSILGLFCIVTGAPAQIQAPVPPAHGLFLEAMDTRINPIDDLYQFANGKWLRTAHILPNHLRSSLFDDLIDRRDDILHGIAEHAASNFAAAPDSAEGLIGAFYRSGMDMAERDRLGIKPLQTELDRISAILDRKSLIVEIAQLQRIDVPAAFKLSETVDPTKSPVYAFSIEAGGTGLPERESYRPKTKHDRLLLQQYTAHVAKMMQLIGSTNPSAEASDAVSMETQLAKPLDPDEDFVDPFNFMTLPELHQISTTMDWASFFGGYGKSRPGRISVRDQSIVANLDHVMAHNSLSQWKHYLRWVLLDTCSPCLSTAVRQEVVRYNLATKNDTFVDDPLWRRVVTNLSEQLHSPMDQLYVEQAFPPSSKIDALRMMEEIKTAYRARITSVAWLESATKQRMLKKLDRITLKVGYPEKWRNYADIKLKPSTYCANLLSLAQRRTTHVIARIGTPIEPAAWRIPVTTVNAFYDPFSNSIEVPAAILLPPLFDPGADDAQNYGGIGSVLAHETAHALDGIGMRFDASGRLDNNWSTLARINSGMHWQAVVRQYDALPPILGVHVSGLKTANENLADIDGLKVAFAALKEKIRNRPKSFVDGFTPEQRFFIAFAQTHRDMELPAEQKRRLKTDTHAPERYRVICSASDTSEFFDAFVGYKPHTPTADPIR